MIFSPSHFQALTACPIRRRGYWDALAKIEALYGDFAETVFRDSAPKSRFCRRSTQVPAVAKSYVTVLI